MREKDNRFLNEQTCKIHLEKYLYNCSSRIISLQRIVTRIDSHVFRTLPEIHTCDI